MPEHESDGSELFGPDNTWWGVYQYTLKFTGRTWPGLNQPLIEDATGEGIARTMELWVHWKGSVVPDNPELTFAGAKRHACMTAHKYIKGELARLEPASYVGTPESTRERALLYRASDAINDLADDEREWESWARDFLDGVTERAAANDEGVAHNAIRDRRKNGLRRIRPLLEEHGLIGDTV